MSTVVALRDKNKIIMGSDSQATIGNLKTFGCRKIFNNNGWLIGFTGEYKLFNVLENELNLESCSDIYSVVCHLETTLEDYEEEVLQLIIAKENKMWYIASELSITEITSDAFSIGSGGNFALGSLVSSTNNKDSEYRLKTALTVASNLDIYTGGEIQIYETENTQ